MFVLQASDLIKKFGGGGNAIRLKGKNTSTKNN